MHFIVGVQFLLITVLYLATTVSCQNVQEIPSEYSRRALPSSVSQRDCGGIKNAEWVNTFCACKDKFFPDAATHKTCVDMLQSPYDIAKNKEARTLNVTSIMCPPNNNTGVCPKLSTCLDGFCICEDGYIRNDDGVGKTCKAGAAMTATFSIFTVFISTLIYFVKSEFSDYNRQI